MSKKLLFKGGHATGMIPFEIEDFSTLYMRDARVDEKTKAYIDSVIGNSVLNLCPYRNVLVTHKYDTVEGNVITLDDCQDDEVIQLSEIQGNTMVNCCKDGSKELTLNGDIDTSGYNNVTLTEGVDGGKVDVSLEGNTMVNVCEQEDPIAITKNYEVTTGNHVALQGEYDGKCRPNIYGNTLVNLADTIETNGANNIINRYDIYLKYIKDNCDYTVIFNANFDSSNTTEMGWLNHATSNWEGKLPNNTVVKGFNKIKITSSITDCHLRIKLTDINSFEISHVVILEGDYTNKPIPDYFTGMKSSFEDKLITDKNDANNGKYKVDYKVTGKNKIAFTELGDILNKAGEDASSTTIMRTSYIFLKANHTYYITNPEVEGSEWFSNIRYDKNKNFIGETYENNETITPKEDMYLRIKKHNPNQLPWNIQLEEGTTATDYEPYKESIKTLYLNSPLLEGDTIEQSGNNIIHNHRYGKVVFDGSADEDWVYWSDNTDNGGLDSSLISFYLSDDNHKQGTLINDKFLTYSTVWATNKEKIALNNHSIISFQIAVLRSRLTTQNVAGLKQWLQQNPITVVYELATPTQEIISANDNLLLDSYTNGHLDVDSVVPIDKVVFKGNFNTSLKYLYPNTEYTIQFESDNIGKIDRLHLGGTNSDTLNVTKGINKYTITTGELSSKSIIINGIGFNASKIVVTPKVDNDFGYFKGMKSVGECEDNKIEILSNNNGSLSNISTHNFSTNGQYIHHKLLEPIKNGESFKICYTNNSNKDVILGIALYYPSGIVYGSFGGAGSHSCVYTNNTGETLKQIVTYRDNDFDGLVIENFSITKVTDTKDTSFVDYKPYKHNKKEILLNEPLRGLPNGVKDKYVIIDGKWYIERNIGDIKLDRNIQWNYNANTDSYGFNREYSLIYIHDEECTKINLRGSLDAIDEVYSLSNNFITLSRRQGYNAKAQQEYIHNECICIKNSRLSTPTDEGFYKWLDDNETYLIYQLAQPTYEPIEYNPFEVYTDITHISNNSTIPCNMMIKNSGYNCILKPNTLYTLALDTNKSGTIEINLGGAKGTTSNSVAKITTPATLTDDILRLYGKGIKSSGIRLLEGDKTNWIPSHFEGMKSCFEDKLQDDGKYKMEILSRNSDESSSNKIQFLLNEPLRGVGDIKDKVYVKEDKVVVERNCASYVIEPTQIPSWAPNTNGIYMYNISVNNSIVNTNYGKVVCNSLPCDVNNAHSRHYANTISTVVDHSVPNGVIRIITDKNSETLKQWLQQNPTTVVYQLATPTYEEIECDLSKLALEGYENATLFYDTNIPVTTQFYEFNVNIKDMLIPNETYYVTFNADRVKDIIINLSGVQVNYKTSMGYNKVPVQLGNVVNTNFSMDSRGVELSDIMISTSTSLIYVKDMNDVCVYDEVNNKYSITITSTGGNESDKRVILLDYPLLRLNKDVYDRLYYSNKDSRYRIDKKVFKHKFTNDHEYSKYTAETNDTYYSSFISLNEAIKDYVVITNEKVKTVKVEDDKYYFKIKWSDLGVSDKTEANGNQGVKDFFNNNEVYLYYATDGFVQVIDGLRRQTLKVYQPETFMKFSGNTTTTVTILIPMKNV